VINTCTSPPVRGLKHGVGLQTVRPRIYSDQGASSAWPPNTLEAFEEALRQGAEGLVLDVGLTADRTLIACNDRLIRALALGPRKVSEVDWSTLRELDLSAIFGGARPLRIPRLEQVWEAFGDRVPLVLRLPHRSASCAVMEALAHVDPQVEEFAILTGNVRALRMPLPTEARVLRYYSPSSPAKDLPPNIHGLALPALGLRSGKPRIGGNVTLVGLGCNSMASANAALASQCAIVLSERPDWLRQRLPTIVPRMRGEWGHVSQRL